MDSVQEIYKKKCEKTLSTMDSVQQINATNQTPLSLTFRASFLLFPNLKKHLRGRRFLSSEAVVVAAEAVLKDLSKKGFQHVFADWQKRWDKSISSNGDYFEKDHQYSENE